MTQTQVPSLSTLGRISTDFGEMRVALRDHLLAPDAEHRGQARDAMASRRADLEQQLRQYADSLVSDDRDRRLLDEFRASSSEWIAAAAEVMALADGGRREEAARLLPTGRMAGLAASTGEDLREWIAHNQALATAAGESTMASLEEARRNTRWPWPRP